MVDKPLFADAELFEQEKRPGLCEPVARDSNLRPPLLCSAPGDASRAVDPFGTPLVTSALPVMATTSYALDRF